MKTNEMHMTCKCTEERSLSVESNLSSTSFGKAGRSIMIDDGARRTLGRARTRLIQSPNALVCSAKTLNVAKARPVAASANQRTFRNSQNCVGVCSFGLPLVHLPASVRPHREPTMEEGARTSIRPKGDASPRSSADKSVLPFIPFSPESRFVMKFSEGN